MIYTVEMTPTAETELLHAFLYIHERAPGNARKWLTEIDVAIASLNKFPARCPLAPEAEHLGEALRHYIFKSHRVIFFIDEPRKIVQVLYVRHAKMRALGEPDGSDE
jgi:plasmid stabilization system protein ParE